MKIKKIIYCLMLSLIPLWGKKFSLIHPESVKNKSQITLNGIVWISNLQWVIWINDERITPDKSPEWLKITHVTETYVEGKYFYEDDWRTIKLRLYDKFPSSDQTNTPIKKVKNANS